MNYQIRNAQLLQTVCADLANANFNATKRLVIRQVNGIYYPATAEQPTTGGAEKETIMVNTYMQNFLKTNLAFALENNIDICNAVSNVVHHNVLSKDIQAQLTEQLKIGTIVKNAIQDRFQTPQERSNAGQAEIKAKLEHSEADFKARLDVGATNTSRIQQVVPPKTVGIATHSLPPDPDLLICCSDGTKWPCHSSIFKHNHGSSFFENNERNEASIREIDVKQFQVSGRTMKRCLDVLYGMPANFSLAEMVQFFHLTSYFGLAELHQKCIEKLIVMTANIELHSDYHSLFLQVLNSGNSCIIPSQIRCHLIQYLSHHCDFNDLKKLTVLQKKELLNMLQAEDTSRLLYLPFIPLLLTLCQENRLPTEVELFAIRACKDLDRNRKEVVEYYNRKFLANIVKDTDSVDTLIESGMLHCHGIEIHQNYNIAFERFKKAASLNFARAYYILGMYYLDGWRCQKNLDLVKKYFQVSAMHSSPEEKYSLGIFCIKSIPALTQDGRTYMQAAAAEEYQPAVIFLAGREREAADARWSQESKLKKRKIDV